MQESDTYLMILEEGEEKGIRESVLVVGEELLGPASAEARAALTAITEIARLKRVLRRTAKAANWQEVLETP